MYGAWLFARRFSGVRVFVLTVLSLIFATAFAAMAQSGADGARPDLPALSPSSTVLEGPISSVFGQAVTFTATVSARFNPGTSPTPTGTVRLTRYDVVSGTNVEFARGPLNAQGVFRAAVTNLPVGFQHRLTAEYLGSSTYEASVSGPALRHTVTVTPRATTTVTMAGPTNSAPGEAVVFTAQVTASSGVPTGTVHLLRTGSTLRTAALDAQGRASFPAISLPLGENQLTVRYAGTNEFEESESARFSHFVGSVAAATTTTLTGPATSTPGQVVTFTATVRSSGGTPTGTVGFRRAGSSEDFGTGTLNAQGVATVSTGRLAPGPHEITARYEGGAGFQPSISAPLTHVVGAAGAMTTTTLTGPAESTFGEPAVFSIAVRSGGGTPGGQVTIRRDGSDVGEVTLGSSGTATATIRGLPLGTHRLTAHYLGATGFQPSASTALVHVVVNAATRPVNDLFANRIVVPGPGRVSGTNRNATAEAGQPMILGQSARPLVWWSFTPSVSGEITIDTDGSDFDTILAVFTGSQLSSLVKVAENDDAAGLALRSRVTFMGVPGTAYQIAVAGFGTAQGNIVLNIAQDASSGFVGGGVVFGQTDACAPILGRAPHAVSVRYSAGELGELPSGVSVVWRDGSEHLALMAPMVPSGTFLGGSGRATWSRFVFYPRRPLIRVVQRQVTQPVGATLANALELVLRLRVQNFGARLGCAVTIAATLRRE